MKNLFIGLTPLHILTAIFSNDRDTSDVVVLLDQKGSLFNFYRVVLKSGVINNFEYIDASKTFHKLSSYLLKGKALKTLSFENKIRSLTRTTYRDVYIFNDLSPEVQLILNRSRYNFVHYIEDGSAAYNSHFVNRGILKQIVLKLCFEYFYDPIKVIGTSRYIDDGMYSFPSYVRTENKIKPVKNLRFERNFRKNLSVLAEQYRDFSIEDSRLNKKCIIYLPKDCTVTTLDLIKYSRKRAKTMGFYDPQIVLKPHPFSSDVANEIFGEFPEVVVCPKDMPGELLPEIYKNVFLVIGVGSSSLMNVKKIYCEIEVVNLMVSPLENFSEFLSDIGIICDSLCYEGD